ncbi:MAG: polysaccharide deacetylase family protein [Verrucomicrobiota bacterium]
MKRSEFIQAAGIGVAGYSLFGLTSGAYASELEGEYQLNAHFVHKGPGLGKRICLTYDDGPTPGVTDKVLNELDKRDIKATFFMIGRKVKQYASLAKEVAAAGHEVANHTYTHPVLSKLSSQRVSSELDQCQKVIEDIIGSTPVWFRPPYGAFRTNQGAIPRGKHLGVAYWSVDPRDWARPGVSTIVRKITQGTRPGSIILLHDLHHQTAQATGPVLDQLLDRHFSFTPMSGFLGDPYGTYYKS